MISISTTKNPNDEHDLSTVSVSGSSNHISINAGWRVRGGSKRLKLTFSRDDALELCTAMLSVLSEGKEEEAITRMGRTGNSMKRFPTFAVNTEKHREALKARAPEVCSEPLLDRRATHYQHIRAPNDRNGNPKRCYVVYNLVGAPLAVFNEGYGGLPDICRGLISLSIIDVYPGEYNAWIKLGKTLTLQKELNPHGV